MAAKAAEPTASGKQKKGWRTFSSAEYRDAIARWVHFSAKATNSNTQAGGVRVARGDCLDLPYVAVRTLDSGAIALDYVSNVGATATIAAQVKAWLEARDTGVVDPRIPAADAVAIEAALVEAATQSYVSPEIDAAVAKRLRQIIVQDQSGASVALTPLASAGLSEALLKRLRTADLKRPRGVLGIGGANPQNVGSRVRDMGSPLYFTAPAEAPELRVALRIHYRGIRIAVPPPLLARYHEWRMAQIAGSGGIMPSTLATRAQEEEFLCLMVREVVRAGAVATAMLDRFIESMPGRMRVATSVEPVVRGWLDPSARERDWATSMASRIRAAIIGAAFQFRGHRIYLGLGEDVTDRWLDVIAAELTE